MLLINRCKKKSAKGIRNVIPNPFADLFAFLISSTSSYLSDMSRVDPNHTKKRIIEVTIHIPIRNGEYDLTSDPIFDAILISIMSEKKTRFI